MCDLRWLLALALALWLALVSWLSYHLATWQPDSSRD